MGGMTSEEAACWKEALHSVQDTKPQQVELRSSVHLPLVHLQAIHLTFHLSITPRGREGGTNGRVVATKALGKACEFGNAAVLGLPQPFIQILVASLCEHQDKGLTELIGAIQVTVSLADVFDLLALLLAKLFRLAYTQPGGARIAVLGEVQQERLPSR